MKDARFATFKEILAETLNSEGQNLPNSAPKATTKPFQFTALSDFPWDFEAWPLPRVSTYASPRPRPPRRAQNPKKAEKSLKRSELTPAAQWACVRLERNKDIELPEVLNLSLLKRVYRTLSQRFHPDKNPAGDATARFCEINEDYRLLLSEFKHE